MLRFVPSSSNEISSDLLLVDDREGDSSGDTGVETISSAAAAPAALTLKITHSKSHFESTLFASV